jgi:hypothetical protein
MDRAAWFDRSIEEDSRRPRFRSFDETFTAAIEIEAEAIKREEDVGPETDLEGARSLGRPIPVTVPRRRGILER